MTRKSTSGAVIMAEGMRLHAHCRGQASVALSSCEAEVMAASEGIKQALLLQEVLMFITTLTRTRTHTAPRPRVRISFFFVEMRGMSSEVGSPKSYTPQNCRRTRGRAADQRGQTPASAHKTLIQPPQRGGDFCRESQGGWEKAEIALAKMATRRECVCMCVVCHTCAV